MLSVKEKKAKERMRRSHPGHVRQDSLNGGHLSKELRAQRAEVM